MINPEMIDYIRTMIKGDHAANDRVEARLDELGWDGFATLLGAVFFFAVNHRFQPDATPGEIVRFVADMRASAPADAPEIDANAAEAMIRAALDPDINIDVDPQMAGSIQGLVILQVLGNNAASDSAIESILSEATGLAERI